MLEVRLLGEQWVAGASGSGGRQPSSRSIALLGYLALHPGVAAARSQLAGIFWPESTESQARTNLRRELHHLRTVLGGDPSLVVAPTTLTWSDSPTCRVDVRTFRTERAAALAALAAQDNAEFLVHATAALDVYRGELLPATYDDWVPAHREQLRQECVDLCDLAVGEWRRSGDHVLAEEVARKRITLDPLGEVGYRVLMQVQAESGDRASAMSTYHRCASVLEQELGISPDAETVRTFEQLLGRGGSPRSNQPVESSGTRRSGAAGRGLIGRGGEAGLLLAQWDQAARGRGGLVLVSGEAGVGKSRLVAELTDVARASGAAVATTRCFGLSGRLPLAPVAEWLRSTHLRQAVTTLEPVWRTEVERLVPLTSAGDGHVGEGIREAASTARHSPGRAGPADGSRPMVDAWQRHRLYEGLARAVLATSRPTLLVLDDLQWCDEETMAWLAYLLGLAVDAPLLVAATVRTDELEVDRGLWVSLRTLRSAGLVTEVPLSPLGADGTEELATSVRGRPLTVEEKAFLHAATGGYPLFVVEAARSLPETETAAGPLPEADLGGVLRHRLEQTSTAAREVAGLAAALGRDFSLDLLTEASDLDAENLVQAVDELWRRRILREQRSGYDFSHDLLRDAAYASVSPPRRWLLHRRLAQGLELVHAGHLDDVAAQLAEQYDRGGRPDLAMHYYAQSAAVAEGVFANAEALRHYRRCLDLVHQLPAGRDRDNKELGVLQSMCAPLNARHGYSSPDLQQTLERSAALAEKLGKPQVLLANLVGLFSVRFVQGHTAQAFEFGTRALELTDGVGDPNLAGQAHFAYAGPAVSLGRPATAIEHFDLACELAPGAVSTLLGTRLEVHARAWAAHAHWLLGHDDQAVAECAAAVARARAVEHPYSLAVALAYAAITHQLRGDRESLRTEVVELRDLCRRYEFAYYGEWGMILAGWATGGQRGVVEIKQGVERLRSLGAFARMPYWLSLLAETLIGCGAVDDARAVLDGAWAAGQQHDDRWWLPEVLRLRAWLDLTPTGTSNGGGSMSVMRPAGVELLNQAIAMSGDQGSPALASRARDDLRAFATATS